SALCAPPLPRRSHELYVPPARETLWSARMASSFFPSAALSTTGSILSAGHGKTARFYSTHHRTVSRMWGGCRISLGAVQRRRGLPMPPLAQILQYDPSLSGADSPGSTLGGKHSPLLCL